MATRRFRIAARLALALVLPALLVPATTAYAAGALDDRTYSVEMGEAGKEEGQEDTLIFHAGTFRSVACDPYGFTAAPYQATEEDGTISFSAEATSETEGRMVWQGKAAGNSITGTAVWDKEGQDSIEYWFRGELAASE